MQNKNHRHWSLKAVCQSQVPNVLGRSLAHVYVTATAAVSQYRVLKRHCDSHKSQLCIRRSRSHQCLCHSHCHCQSVASGCHDHSHCESLSVSSMSRSLSAHCQQMSYYNGGTYTKFTLRRLPCVPQFVYFLLYPTAAADHFTSVDFR